MSGDTGEFGVEAGVFKEGSDLLDRSGGRGVKALLGAADVAGF